MDSGAGRNLLSKDSMPEEWNGFIIDPPENLIFRTGGGERKTTKAIELKGQISGLNTFYIRYFRNMPSCIVIGNPGRQPQKGFCLASRRIALYYDRLGDLKRFCPASGKIHMEARENAPIIRGCSTGRFGWKLIQDQLLLIQMLSPLEVRAQVPETVLLDLLLSPDPCETHLWTCLRPKVSDEALKEKPEKLPHLGDERMSRDEPKPEPLHAPLNAEDEEANPWTPSLREHLEEEAKVKLINFVIFQRADTVQSASVRR